MLNRKLSFLPSATVMPRRSSLHQAAESADCRAEDFSNMMAADGAIRNGAREFHRRGHSQYVCQQRSPCLRSRRRAPAFYNTTDEYSFPSPDQPRRQCWLIFRSDLLVRGIMLLWKYTGRLLISWRAALMPLPLRSRRAIRNVITSGK